MTIAKDQQKLKNFLTPLQAAFGNNLGLPNQRAPGPTVDQVQTLYGNTSRIKTLLYVVYKPTYVDNSNLS